MPSLEKIEFLVDSELCERCGSCEAVCPSEVFAWVDDRINVLHTGWCIKCGHCVAACPNDALTHSAFEKDGFAGIEGKASINPEELEKLFMQRRSCRRFKDEPLSSDQLDRLIDTARYSPTATNAQNVRYVILSDQASIRRLIDRTAEHYLKLERSLKNPFVRFAIGMKEGAKTVSAYKYHISAIAERFRKMLEGEDGLFYGASAVIVVCASGMPHLAAAGCNLAAMQILLAAESMGLGACYNGYALTALVRDKQARRMIGVPSGYRPWAVIAVGKPGGEFYKVPSRRKRRVVWSAE
jgi:nitroreductase/NAD-dependent dihydropyrimidine dehydrogenase PreA subunit